MESTSWDQTEADRCRTAVGDQAGQFGAIGDSFGSRPASSSAFGDLGCSAELSRVVTELDQVLGDEFAAAERWLRDLERTIDSVGAQTSDTDERTAHQFNRRNNPDEC